jgi:hypothetical protein
MSDNHAARLAARRAGDSLMENSESQSQSAAARRRALKVLAAATGAVVGSQVPVRWSKAGVSFGVLPVHAQGSASLTIASCGAPVEFEPDTDPLTSTCTITPATAGISMHYQITFSNAGFDGADPSSGDVLTNGSGVASITTGPITSTFGSGFVGFTWTFTNPADGTGTCNQVFSWGTPN